MLRDDPNAVIPYFAGDDDPLGQAPALQTLVRSLIDMPHGACVALYGAWGSGKTVLLRNAQRILDPHRKDALPEDEAAKLPEAVRVARANTISLWFDPWEYDRMEDVLSPLLKQLTAVALSSPWSHKAGQDALDSLARHAWAFAKTVGRHSLRALVRWGVGVTVDQLTDELSAEAKANAQALKMNRDKPDATYLEVLDGAEQWASESDLIEALKQGFAALTRMALGGGVKPDQPAPEGRRFIVFLDDLDRCLPERVVHLIEAVKLLLCSAGAPVVFVFGLDRSVVGEAIRQQYPGAKGYTGENYLEKIFELALEAPPAAPDGLRAYAERLFDQLEADHTSDLSVDGLIAPFKGSAQAEKVWRAVLGQPHFDNPRVIKRAVNRLHLIGCGPGDLVAWIKEKSQGRKGEALLHWVVGLERYRELRRYLRDATNEEFSLLWSALAQPGGVVHTDTAQRILQIPGVRGFRKSLNPLDEGGAHKPPLLVDFDQRLRRIGL